jgi:hypothetical protein
VLAPKIEVPDSKKYNYNKKGHKYCGLFYYDVAELFEMLPNYIIIIK